ncbi:MerR family transcriptional regulator [Galbitalea sp. SE-J8]|uniref:MerR family transcriptional regulator n=1 Tax=Galbitalea sp. SE-J8 TaxID=3054952 RepID=UPI00259CDBEA|nr:MerR family transcriptional regulator [Galbitalea sp. SE-J8]MDM4762214.1 MerR family transcriptional regulator [Galbitalea sp. SE-J8]
MDRTDAADRSIADVARLAGTTTRTLRHYDAIGLLRPTRVAANGHRYYDAEALAALQRILLLRDLGLGLPTIADVLAGRRDHTAALIAHVEVLRAERGRLDRRISSVEATIRSRRGGSPLMAEQMFDGFDHTEHREEVERRWGRDAYASGDTWWRGLGEAGQRDWRAAQAALAADWTDAATRGVDPAGDEALALAARHAEWLAGIPGTPGYPDGPTDGYLLGLGELYVADPRFAANYGGEAGAAFVRDALAAYVARAVG